MHISKDAKETIQQQTSIVFLALSKQAYLLAKL